MRGAMQRAMTALEKGNSEFGITPLDPFKVSQLNLEKGNGGALSLDMTLSEAELVGFKNARVESVKTDMNKFKIVATMRTDKLDLNSLYKVTGRVLVIPINGNGKTTIKMPDLLSTIVSENDRVIMAELQPAISQAFNKRLLDVTNRIFEKVAFEDVFPQ
ncbi:hypothetical protein FOCC_FOCC004625 [Frankliniella occidentalis]|nr:hypothetical protein FOCC_FOCC004625 [Frankliniella occidentalis]